MSRNRANIVVPFDLCAAPAAEAGDRGVVPQEFAQAQLEFGRIKLIGRRVVMIAEIRAHRFRPGLFGTETDDSLFPQRDHRPFRGHALQRGPASADDTAASGNEGRQVRDKIVRLDQARMNSSVHLLKLLLKLAGSFLGDTPYDLIARLRQRSARPFQHLEKELQRTPPAACEPPQIKNSIINLTLTRPSATLSLIRERGRG